MRTLPDGKDMTMGHTPYGYRIENGKAVIDEEAAAKIKKLYEAYLAGASFQSAANEAGIEVKHCGAKRMMANRHYLGDDFYPAIIDNETFDKAEAEKQHRAEALGRLDRKKEKPAQIIPTNFRFEKPEKSYKDPAMQAQYLYSLIETEAM
jgi:hypothetical protein